MATGEGSVFSRSVTIGELTTVQIFQRLADMRQAKAIDACQELPEAFRSRQLGIDHFMEEPGREPEFGHCKFLDGFRKVRQRGDLWRREHEACAIQKRSPELESGGIEGNWSQLQENVQRRDGNIIGVFH